MSTSTLYSRHIKKVINYLEYNYGVESIATSETRGEFNQEAKQILFSNRISKEIQLYILLHEAGHAKLLLNNRKQYEKHYPFYHISDERRTNKKQRIDILREEISAWDEGLNIAKELKIKINLDRYLHHYRRNLWTYIEWTINPNQASFWPMEG